MSASEELDEAAAALKRAMNARDSHHAACSAINEFNRALLVGERDPQASDHAAMLAALQERERETSEKHARTTEEAQKALVDLDEIDVGLVEQQAKERVLAQDLIGARIELDRAALEISIYQATAPTAGEPS